MGHVPIIARTEKAKPKSSATGKLRPRIRKGARRSDVAEQGRSPDKLSDVSGLTVAAAIKALDEGGAGATRFAKRNLKPALQGLTASSDAQLYRALSLIYAAVMKTPSARQAAVLKAAGGDGDVKKPFLDLLKVCWPAPNDESRRRVQNRRSAYNCALIGAQRKGVSPDRIEYELTAHGVERLAAEASKKGGAAKPSNGRRKVKSCKARASAKLQPRHPASDRTARQKPPFLGTPNYPRRKGELVAFKLQVPQEIASRLRDPNCRIRVELVGHEVVSWTDIPPSAPAGIAKRKRASKTSDHPGGAWRVRSNDEKLLSTGISPWKD